MSDIIDQAQAVETLARDISLRTIQAQAREFAQPGAGRCEDCDDRIEEERLRVLPGAIRCLRCQTAREGRIRTLFR